QEHVAAGRVLEVQANRGLVAVEREEQGTLRAVVGSLVVRRGPAHVVAHAEVLDLDHLGAEVGQQQRAEAAGQQAREVEYADPFERQTHGGSYAAARSDRPSRRRASATVAGRRPALIVISRALAMRSPFERAISPSGR